MYFGAVNTGYVIALFLPTILKQLGYTSSQAQIHSIPVYLVAAVVMLTIAALTDKMKRRYPFILVGCSIATVGYIILLAQKHVPVGVRYMAVFFIAAGGHSTHPITLGWLANNVSGHYKRAISTAIQISIGNFAGFVGSNIFIDANAPLFKVGYGVSLACIWLTVVTSTLFVLGLKWENKKRDRGERDWRLQLPADEVQNLGDDHPSWRFSY
jgi:Fungal trichothecene efflux pump (TRI12)